LPSEIKRYAIADYLSNAQKQAILGRTYTKNKDGDVLCSQGRCPLGVATGTRTPLPATIADCLTSEHGRPWRQRSPQWGAICEAAIEFVADWDDGYLRAEDLPAALGVEAPDAD
jgi:hypothetical protein